MSPFLAMWRTWATAALLAFVFASAPPLSGQRPDTAAFAAVVRAVIAQRPYQIQVDPRPLRADADITEAVAESRAPVTEDELAARSAVLARLGVPMGNPSLPAHCVGVRAPPGDGARTGCPAIQTNVISIGIPRPDFSAGACHKDGQCTRWLTRVIETAAGPAGIAVVASDYSMEQAGPFWRFISKRLLTWSE